MKQKLLFLSIVILAILFSNSKIYGQSSENESELKTFGLGLYVEQFKFNDFAMDIRTAPANKIIFTITPTNNFRLEPEIGFNFHNDKDRELKDKSIHFGIGGFAMFQRGKTNIYGGLRFEYANISYEYIHWNSGDKQTEKTNRLAIGPAIGAEFFFGHHFSIGGEIGLKYMNLNAKDSQYNDDKDIKQTYFTTDSAVLLRFYL